MQDSTGLFCIRYEGHLMTEHAVKRFNFGFLL